jgi:hypothetical protein
MHGQSMTSTRVPLERFAQCEWLRVTVVDKAGKSAWSNPVWRDVLT